MNTIKKMSQRQKNITTLKPIKNKILDLETKRLVHYVSITTKTIKDKIYNCWWCTLPIDDSPIGCPISMQINKGPTTLSDPGPGLRPGAEGLDPCGPSSPHEVTYYTDGLFCCYNCIKAYIMDYGEHDAKYKDSIRFLAMMVCDNEQTTDPVTINPSPPWRFLQQYGGHVKPEQYREMIGRMIYKEKGIIQIQPITTLFEEDEIF